MNVSQSRHHQVSRRLPKDSTYTWQEHLESLSRKGSFLNMVWELVGGGI
jgi:hypothetical protein